jgi:hypothetical protein
MTKWIRATTLVFVVLLASVSCNLWGEFDNPTDPIAATQARLITGTTGPSAAIGVNGDLYLDTTSSTMYVKVGGAWMFVADLKGATGPAGATWHTGSGVPASLLGVEGDLYLDAVTLNVYKKSGSTWSVVVNLLGPQGPVGETGPTGPQGPQGLPGNTWYTGTGAPTSDLGSNGDLYLDTATTMVYKKTLGAWFTSVLLQGIQGPEGLQGPVGPAGPEGPQGPAGATFDWVISSLNHFVAESNKGYIIRSSEKCTVQLPLNPSIGETIELVADNIHGWKIDLKDATSILVPTDSSLWGKNLTSNGISNDFIGTPIFSSSDDGSIVYVAFYKGGGSIWKSSDRGKSWLIVNTAGGYWRDIECSADGSIVLAVNSGYSAIWQDTTTNVWVSVDGGSNWTSQVISGKTTDIAINSDGSSIYAGDYLYGNGLYKSIDYGNTWSLISSGVFSEIIVSGDGSTLYSINDQVVSLSQDKGATWQQLQGVSNVKKVACSYDGQKIILFSSSSGLLKSVDHGVIWTNLSEGYTNFNFVSLSYYAGINVLANNYLYVSMLDGNVYYPFNAVYRVFNGIHLSQDGSLLLALTNQGEMLISNTDRIDLSSNYVFGKSRSQIRLVYTGGGVYRMIQSSGVLEAVAY